MNKHIDIIVLITGIVTSIALLLSVSYLELYALWGSLVVLIIVVIFYSTTFFSSNNPYEKLAYYLVMLPILIGYFALVYKAFGIIDSSNNETIKPDWLNSIYFSVVTWTTLGYGDYRPIEELKAWVIIEALMGYVYMGLLIGKLLFVSSKAGRQKA